MELLDAVSDVCRWMAFEIRLRLVIWDRHDLSEIEFLYWIFSRCNVFNFSFIGDRCVVELSWNFVKRKMLIISHSTLNIVSSHKLRKGIWMTIRLIVSSSLRWWVLCEFLPVLWIGLLNQFQIDLIKAVHIDLWSLHPIINFSKIRWPWNSHQRVLYYIVVEKLTLTRVRSWPFHLLDWEFPSWVLWFLIDWVVKCVNLRVALNNLRLIFLWVLVLSELDSWHD